MTPFECALLVGRTWQLTQAIARDSAGAVAPWFTCARWTPATPVADATTGGEAAWFRSAPATLTRAAAPWQEVQDMPLTSMVPFRWVARLTVVAV